MTGPVELTIYTRTDCHLCALAKQRLERAREETTVDVEIEAIDVDADPELAAEYGDRVPVVLVEGDLAFTYTVDVDELAATLRAKS